MRARHGAKGVGVGVQVWRVDAGVARGSVGVAREGGGVWRTGVWVRGCGCVGAVRGVWVLVWICFFLFVVKKKVFKF